MIVEVIKLRFKEINLKLIFLESLSLFFIINGIQRLYMASQGEEYDAIFNNDFVKIELLFSNRRIGDFFMSRGYWTLGIIFFGVLLIGLINHINKFKFINSFLVLLLIFTALTSGFFYSGIVNNYINYFCGIFAEGYGLSFFIGGAILTLIGIAILRRTIRYIKIKSYNISII